jgi:wyosine [tRNA(Phe)-imidazoG37] synthetase (radical SAM superfamily)
VEDVRKKTKTIVRKESLDYLTFVPDGEPTLDINLGKEIELLKPLGIKIAVITNSSLIDQSDVREDLMKADLVSLKIDSISEETWRGINQPSQVLQLSSVLDGLVKFSGVYRGELITETMLIKGINDSCEHVGRIADFVAGLEPAKSYLSIPTRPPAEKWVQAPRENVINQAYQIFRERIENVEHLIGYEGNAFSSSGDVEGDMLSIMSVHPMREDAVHEFLTRSNAGWEIIHRLIAQGRLIELAHEGKKFYMLKLPGRW